MAFVMAKLEKAKSGAYKARKGIPKDVREEYRRQHGVAWEARFHAPAGLAEGQAKARYGAWLDEIETRIESIRASAKGEGRSLTWREAQGLVGEWYRWFVGRHEEEPGHPENWNDLLNAVQDALFAVAPSWFKNNHTLDEHLEWTKAPEARLRVRPIIADMAETSQFLAHSGVVLGNEARDLFLDAVEDEFVAAIRLLKKRAEGDYRPDGRLQKFPAFSVAAAGVASGVSPDDLFGRWIEQKRPKPATVNRWQAVFLNLSSHFEGRAADSIAPKEAREWKDGLVTPKRSARTVSDVWPSAVNTVFAWAEREQLIGSNPFSQVHVTVPKKSRLRETASFTQEETRTILDASLRVPATDSAFVEARRWVPWLCAYSGARAEEITQLRVKDVEMIDGIIAMRITPEAGTTKTGEPRTVPLHEHIVAQGFIDFVRARGDGPLLYNPEPAPGPVDPRKPRRPRYVKTRERLAGWIRRIGITDKEVQPNHAWRHTFKQIAERAGISERMSDEITGHSPLTIGRGYGRPTLADLAKVMERFPRYEIR